MKIKLGAAYRLRARRQVHAAEELITENGFRISSGGNSYKFPNPEEAYEKAAQFIKQIQRDGFKYTPHGTMSDKMDVYKKGGQELSISVHKSLLNVDLW